MSDMSFECFPWAMLAQSDGKLVKQMVEYDGREASRALRLHFERNCATQLGANQDLARCSEKLRESHSLFEKYLIRHDNFGGFRLLYVGELKKTG